MRLSDKISGSLSSKYDKSILTALNESCEEKTKKEEVNYEKQDLKEEVNYEITWDNYEDYSEEEIEEINNILNNLDLTAIKHEGDKEDGYSVAVKDNNSGMVFWLDYIKEGPDIYGEFNQYIFKTDNSDDRIRQAIQTSMYEDGTTIAFEAMESEGLQYLEDKGLVTYTDNNDMIFESSLNEVKEVNYNDGTKPDYIFTDDDVTYIQNLVGDNYVVTLDSDSCISINVITNEYIRGGLLGLNDTLKNELQEYYKEIPITIDIDTSNYSNQITLRRNTKKLYQTESCKTKLDEDIKDDTASAAKQIALEIQERGIMGFDEIDNMAADILGITVEELRDQQLDTDIHISLNYEGIDNNMSTGDFYTQEYAEEHPEVLEESDTLKLSGKMKKVPVDKNKITITPSLSSEIQKKVNDKKLKKEDLKEETLNETDATPEFLEDLKNLINNHMRVSDIAQITLDNMEGQEYAVIAFESGGVKRINITANSNLAVARAILFELA